MDPRIGVMVLWVCSGGFGDGLEIAKRVCDLESPPSDALPGCLFDQLGGGQRRSSSEGKKGCECELLLSIVCSREPQICGPYSTVDPVTYAQENGGKFHQESKNLEHKVLK